MLFSALNLLLLTLQSQDTTEFGCVLKLLLTPFLENVGCSVLYAPKILHLNYCIVLFQLIYIHACISRL